MNQFKTAVVTAALIQIFSISNYAMVSPSNIRESKHLKSIPDQDVANRNPKTIRVLINRLTSTSKTGKPLSLRGLDLKIQAFGESERAIETVKENNTQIGQASVDIWCDENSVNWTETIQPAQPPKPPNQLNQERKSQSIRIYSPSNFLSMNGNMERGSLEIKLLPVSRECLVIQEMNIEDYIVGVLEKEVNSAWDKKLLEAQAVISRSYAIHEAIDARKRGRAYDVEGSVKDQVYGGFKDEKSKTALAVKNTKGIVLFEKEHQLVAKSFYHSTCGGHTKLPEEVWGAKVPGFKRSVECPFCKTSPRYNWKAEINRIDLEKTLASRFPYANRANQDFEKGTFVTAIPIRSPSSLERVELKWANQSKPNEKKTILQKVSANDFRLALGSTLIKSTSFTFAPANALPATFQVSGNGYGHGVGLCQYGAKAMADQGYSRDQILQYYYPDLSIIRL